MSYTPTTWETGDTITAEKLNNMEVGIDDAVNPFIVNLTPTALDYSGVMDKTVAEIYAAYQAGSKILFRVWSSATQFMEVECTARFKSTEEYPSFNGFILLDSGEIMFAYTGAGDDGTRNTYAVETYKVKTGIVEYEMAYERDLVEGTSRIILLAAYDAILAAYNAGAVITARGNFADVSMGDYSCNIFYLSYIDTNNTQVNFMGHDPGVGGVDVVTFYSDASGETMSTDGGYVPT